MKNKSAFSLTVQRAGEIILYAIAGIVFISLVTYMEGGNFDPKAMVYLFIFSLFIFFAGFWFGEAVRQGKETSKKTSLKRKIFTSLDRGIHLFLLVLGILVFIGFARYFYMGWF